MANPTIDNLHPAFLQQLLAFVAASGGSVRLEGGSGWRSYAKQAQLYADWVAGRHPAPSVARPGSSKHNHGLAFDLVYGPGGREWALANASRFGLRFPMGDEPWHIEPLWAAQAMGSTAGGLPAGVDFGFQVLTAEQAKDQAKTLYGHLGWYVDHPEVGPLIVKAAQQGWDPERLKGALAKTNWWRTTAESARQWDALVMSDRATADRRIAETKLSLRLEAGRLGIPADDKRFYEIAWDAQRFGWNDDELRLALVAELRFNPRGVGGAIGHTMGEVGDIAASYMVPVTDRQRFEWAKRIHADAADRANVETQMRRLAVAQFPHLAALIDRGSLPSEIFAPLRNTIAQVLEMSPDDIDLMDERWAPVTSYSDPRTGQVRNMTFAEAERYARAHPSWSNTANAWDAVTQAGDTLLSIFGEVA